MKLEPLDSLSLAEAAAQAAAQAGVARGADERPAARLCWHVRLAARTSSLVQDPATESWEEGPPVSPSTLADSGELKNHILALSRRARGPEHVHVIVHLADEFASNIQREGAGTPARSAQLGLDPQSVLTESVGDVSVHSWINAPFSQPATIAPRARVARWQPFVDALERACPSGLFGLRVMSAPLEAAAVALSLSEFAGQRAFAYWIYFPSFSVLASFSESGAALGFRYLDHGGDPLPTGISGAVNDFIVACSIPGCAFGILPCGEQPLEQAQQALQRGLGKGTPQFDLHAFETLTREDVAQAAQKAGASGALNAMAPEHLFWVGRHWTQASGPVKACRSDCAGNFFRRPPDQEAAVLPSRDAGMFRAGILLRPFAWGLLVLGAGLGVFWAWTVISAPQWQVSPEQVAAATTARDAADADLRHLRYIDSSLRCRSSAAFNLLLLHKLFPPDSGVRVTQFRYNAELDVPATRPGDGKGYVVARVVRTWNISGHAPRKSLEYIQDLGSPGTVQGAMALAATELGMPETTTSAPGGIEPSTRLQQPQSIEGEERYPFDLTIKAVSDDPEGVIVPK